MFATRVAMTLSPCRRSDGTPSEPSRECSMLLSENCTVTS